MRAEIISVGTELLLGDIVNTNARFLSQELASLGYTVYYQTVVGDNAVRLRTLLQEAKDRSDVLVLSGGLGPTEDDLTKETVAEVFGDILVLDRDELAGIEAFFKSRGREMSENNKKQAMVPRRGKKLPNPNGTAPGAFFRQGNKYAFLLPGPPREMEPMFLDQVRPMLEAMQDSAIRSLTLHVAGIGESDLEEKVQDLLEGSNPTAALYAKTGEVHIRVTAKADTAGQADIMCAEYAALFEKLLGDYIYSRDGENLETTVVQTLLANGETVATAESCTGGLLSERLTSVPGASAVFGFGAVTYANEVKHELVGVSSTTLRRYGAVSSQVAAEMAYGAAKRGGADYGVGITGIAGPDGGTERKPVGLVYIAVAMGREVFIRKMQMGGRSREYVRIIATQNALEMLRRLALALPVPDAKRFTKGEQAEFERAGKPRRKGGAAGRITLAVILVAVVLALLVGGIYLFGSRGEEEDPLRYPSSEGLRYGTAEYTVAAQGLVASAAADEPDVVGFIALPFPAVEELVRQTAKTQQELLVEEVPQKQAAAVLSSGALPARTVSNTLVVAENAFAPLLELANTGNAKQISTFTYYTSRDAKVYEIYAVFLFDEGDSAADGFDPAVQNLSSYEEHLDFVLGTKSRSLYEIPVDFVARDSFMSLTVDDPEVAGRRLYVCGRLLRADESPETVPAAAPAGAPLMPAAYYTENALPQPNTANVYAFWLNWYMTRHLTNAQLQYEAGMPAADRPLVLSGGEEEDPAVSSASSSQSAAASSSQEEADSENSAADGSSSGAGSESPGSSSENASDVSASAASGASSTGSTASSADSTSASSQAPSSSSQESDAPPEEPAEPVSPGVLTVTMNGQKVTGTTLNVLSQICQREVPAASPETIKAVAVAAHSWIRNQQQAGNEAPGVLGMPPSADVRGAVGKVLQYIVGSGEAAPAFTPSFSMAAMGTNTAAAVWGGERAYLKTVTSAYEQSNSSWRSIYTIPQEDMEMLLVQNFGFAAEQNLAPEMWFADIEKNDGGYVTSMKIGGVQITGSIFWQEILLEDGQPVLASPAFEIEYDGKNFIVTCYGVGHGCGLSLAGAEGYAREGWSFERILAHYFPGTKLFSLTKIE